MPASGTIAMKLTCVNEHLNNQCDGRRTHKKDGQVADTMNIAQRDAGRHTDKQDIRPGPQDRLDLVHDGQLLVRGRLSRCCSGETALLAVDLAIFSLVAVEEG